MKVTFGYMILVLQVFQQTTNWAQQTREVKRVLALVTPERLCDLPQPWTQKKYGWWKHDAGASLHSS
jgi:hypothetical protein